MAKDVGSFGAAPACSVAAATMARPRGCSDRFSAAPATASNASSLTSFSPAHTATTCGSPVVSVPVLSKHTRLTCARRSSASPSRTRKPCLVALPIAAMMAVGVASTSAHGQKTTRMNGGAVQICAMRQASNNSNCVGRRGSGRRRISALSRILGLLRPEPSATLDAGGAIAHIQTAPPLCP